MIIPAAAWTTKLQSVIDASTDASGKGYPHGTFTYTYDANGNMTTDNSKGLIVTYNMLNLPLVNTLSDGTITYTYDATGRKLRKVSTFGAGNTTDYIDGIEYDGSSITFVQTEEGRILNPTSTPNYEYSLADHLGNSRINFDSSHGGSTATQVDDYLPFGLSVQSASTSPANDYLYNGKELQEETGFYDYGARFYDPVIARWTSVDPLAEKYRKWSPYNYGVDNPVTFTDPDGMGVSGCCGVLTALGDPMAGYKIAKAAVKSVIYTLGTLLAPIDDMNAGGHMKVGSPQWKALQQKGIQDTKAAITTGLIMAATDGFVGRVASVFSPVAGEVTGSWVSESTSGWSNAAKAYQEQITGVSAGNAFEVNGVKFDGLKDGTLLEAKSSYDGFVGKDGQFQDWFKKGADALVNQAQRQVAAADGASIEWNFSSQKSLDATKRLFEDNGVTGINLKYTPPKPQ